MPPQPPLNLNELASWVTAAAHWLIHAVTAYPTVAIFIVIALVIFAYLPPIVWLIGLLILLCVLINYHLL